MLEQLEKPWLSCWQEVDRLPLDALQTLLSALARLPFSVASIARASLPAISKAVSALLTQATQADETALDGNDDTLESAVLVERVVTRLLKATWDLKREDVKDALDEMVALADASLNIRLKTYRPVRSRLAALLSEMEKPWSIKVKDCDNGAADERLALIDWRHPTVAWLADYKIFQPALLPKLQLARMNGGRVYESKDEYFATIVQLWIGMTFLEGNNALLPHCTVKMGDKVCDQPLWPLSGKNNAMNCRNSHCDRYATFLCAHSQHVKGYCSKCAGEYQQRLRGPPSKHASTHIYDGFIARVKYDGTILVEQVASRRPPLSPIHWKTTRRLSSPNLVGILRLSNREASLRNSDDIFWGEIGFQGKSFDEYKARENGCLTLRLLQYLEEPGNAMLTHNPTAGEAIAIIDCQTFVPEFVPVLKALEKQRQMPMPFQDGALLNLCEQVNFRHEHVTGVDDNSGDECIESGAGKALPDTRGLIREVICASILDPIIDIRRDEALRGRLETSLVQLVNSATLDPGQLKSFAEALTYPVHCTQGPPGTGKSYLGVVVVRALLIVRDLWKLKNGEVGDPPVLVLSYKNHAIDEFLLELLHSNPTLNHVSTNTGFRNYYRGSGFKKLVRIGGGCSEPELEQYRERNVACSDPCVQAVSERIEDCQVFRETWIKFRDCFTPIFAAHATRVGSAKLLSPEEQKVVQNAVPPASLAVATLLQVNKSIHTVDKTIDKTERVNNENGDEMKYDVGDIVASLEQQCPVASPFELARSILEKKAMLKNEDFARLYEGVKHYDLDINPQEVLYQWIIGFRPRPVCMYTTTPCYQVCANKSRFCQEHSCKFTRDDEHFCNEIVASDRIYCNKHLCSADQCQNCRISETQKFCDDHACFVCLVRSEVADVALEEPPRNSCERHPLCWGLDGMCPEVAESNNSFCKIHTEDLYCKWVTKSGKTCRAIASAGQYCGTHYSEATRMAARTAKTSSETCQAHTRKGKACKGKALSDSSYCRDHVGRTNQFTSKGSELLKLDAEDSQDMNDAKRYDEAVSAWKTVKFGEHSATTPIENDQVSQSSKIEEPTVKIAGAGEMEVEELYSSGSDVEDFVDAMQYDNKDEVEESEHLRHLRDVPEVPNDKGEDAVQYDNGDEVEESEHLQHLRDVLEVKDDEEEDAISIVEEIEEKTTWVVSEQQLLLPSEWHWDMELEERWNALYSVLALWGPLNGCVQDAVTKELNGLKVELHREILRANSRVYEGKAVIGGTITGCVSRLEAIRTTNPFAILVEEASEVMEPLLVSCFGTSTRKLEMIGDHMQLQPSVMGRIDFERVNKITISMFERLISAPPSNKVPSSVLSIQRRMRKNICDLTRNFYREITVIEDHEVCGKKVIGSQVNKSPSLLDACEGGGREVPGVSPHIYFWTHSGAQRRASVGLSRVNQQEANMTCKLVHYLVHCGVSPKSIAVLTPYKGQLMLMRNMLMNNYRLRMMPAGRDARPIPSCVVSTVDRFQGDEADIVIISLVIDGKSRTPFVKLQNRMIVLLSRARLGMYVVGNVDYFDETTHWQKTLGLLRKDAGSDNVPPTECTMYIGSRIGSSLPICCPQHRTSVAFAANERDLKLGFCLVVCSIKLSCSHRCGLKCHWPKVNDHNSKCHVEVESPCSLHPRIVVGSVITAFARGKSIDEALPKFQCDIQVEVSLPCGHIYKMSCYMHQNIVAGQAPWPVCSKAAIAPYVYPVCKHILECTCSEFDRYSKGKAPPCTELVKFAPPCQHTVQLSCHDRQDYADGVRPFVCKEKVQVSLPRCRHKLVVPCSTAETLNQWTGKSCLTLNCVQEGEEYGSKDYFCKQKVTFQRRCGHSELVRCERAFELVQIPSCCREPIVVANPECGHELSTTCSEEKSFRVKIAQNFAATGDVSPLETVHEGDSSNFRSYGLNFQCSHETLYVRLCGHEKTMKCSEARHNTRRCDELVTAKLPTCGHLVKLMCHLMKYLSAWQPWEAQTPLVKQLHDESIVNDTLSAPGARPVALKTVLKDCEAAVRFRRTTACGHDIEMKCCDALKIVSGNQSPSPCRVHVTRAMKCGHEVLIKCSDDVNNVNCQESVEKSCWNYDSCGSKVMVPCKAFATTVRCTAQTEWICSKGHSFLLQLCCKGTPSDCPLCSSMLLESAIQDTQRMLSNKTWSPTTTQFLPHVGGVTYIEMSPASKHDFLVRKIKLLRRFKEGLSDSSVWTNPLFSPVEFPVFAVLGRKLQALRIDKFEMKDFGSMNTFSGIEVYEATKTNFERILRSGNRCLLFGSVYTVKSLRNTSDIPKKNNRKGGSVAKWAARQSTQGFDALCQDTRGWIIWKPYALYPVCRVDICDSNRVSILNSLPTESQPVESNRKISFRKASEGEEVEECKPDDTMQRPSVISELELEKIRLLASSISPLYEQLDIWYPWNGKSLSTGAAVAIPAQTEKTLASKLNFIPRPFCDTTGNRLKIPFGGIKYVETLMSNGKLKEYGNLFLALEHLAVRKQDTLEVRSKLEQYVNQVCIEEECYAHPLVVVAIARLASRLSQSDSSDVQRRLLHIFASLYPEASELWLDESEIRLAQTTSGQFGSVDSIKSGSLTSVDERWETLKSQYGCRSDAMEELLKMVGLKKVKQAAVNLFKNAMTLQQLSSAQRKKNVMSFNYCFVGNPGTGKTTVARLFANVLKDSKIRRTNTFVECTAQKVKDDGAAEFRLKLQQASGGVVFIDEAYELDPAGDFKGKPIVAELLTAAEDKRGDLSIILAGYEDDIQKKLYAYNDGLPSRFQEVVFEDFDAQELEVVWDGLAKDRGWEYEEATVKVACRRLAKAKGHKGFGNARAVRKLFEQAMKEAMAREDFDGDLKFDTVDLLGDRPSTNTKLQDVLNEVNERTGWHKVKEELRKLVQISDTNYERELKGLETIPVSLNRLFLGNPGTGKTTCAEYFGRVLKALHFLSNGAVVKKAAGDFIGSHVGESQTKTAQILDMAKGKVLVIDEAYNLNDNKFGKQVLDVLVEKVQGTECDDLAVLLIGYERKMLEMLRTQNPGLRRRFPPEHAFHFEDYTEHELLDILEFNCAKRSVTCSYEVADAMLKQLALQRTQPNFGNAGAVEQLLKQALGRAMNRPMVHDKTLLTLEDVGVKVESSEQDDPLNVLNALYRMDNIKEQLTQLKNEIIVADHEGSGLPEVGHFVFRGSPGTGKTTVARAMAKILHGLGVLATTKMVETSGLDLTAEYVGQTKQKVTAKLGEAKGGLLFIDEAYELGKGTFAEEAMTTLVAAMTDPSYVGMVIIIAGYSKDMDQMLSRNVGLKSRFRRFVDFSDWEAEDAVEFLTAKAEAENFEVEDDAVVWLQKTFEELKKLSNFGNGRDAMAMWKEILQHRAQRVVKEPEEERTITSCDVEKASEAMMVARRGCAVPHKGTAAMKDPMKLLDGLYRMSKIEDQLLRLQKQIAVADREGSARPEIGHFVFRGSPGTGKTTVARVMAQILHAMSALCTTKLVETSGLELTGEYVGQTKTKVTEKLVEAKGGLLFIDEAYELGKGKYGEEAMTMLVAAMTDPSYAGMVIVIAGYPKDMDIMLDRNAGLKSRFKRFIDFPDWEAEDGVSFLRMKALKEGIMLEPGAALVMQRMFVKLKKLPGFGNGRDAVGIWEELKQCRAQRVFNSPEDVRTITAVDAALAGESILAARRPPDGSILSQSSISGPDDGLGRPREQEAEIVESLCEQFGEQESETRLQEAEAEETEVSEGDLQVVEVEAEQDEEPSTDEDIANEERDDGVPDEDWEELQRAKQDYAAHLDALRRARDQAKIEEEKRKAEAIQEKIRQICLCPAGYTWYKCGGGLSRWVSKSLQWLCKGRWISLSDKVWHKSDLCRTTTA
uniref:AAA+ ATPase domain-containing protein n=1 Tax=Peronospora matthiolae TaxID=2874970 RepID=A0AAV1UG65_9STRA